MLFYVVVFREQTREFDFKHAKLETLTNRANREVQYLPGVGAASEKRGDLAGIRCALLLGGSSRPGTVTAEASSKEL